MDDNGVQIQAVEEGSRFMEKQGPQVAINGIDLVKIGILDGAGHRKGFSISEWVMNGRNRQFQCSSAEAKYGMSYTSYVLHRQV